MPSGYVMVRIAEARIKEGRVSLKGAGQDHCTYRWLRHAYYSVWFKSNCALTTMWPISAQVRMVQCACWRKSKSQGYDHQLQRCPRLLRSVGFLLIPSYCCIEQCRWIRIQRWSLSERRINDTQQQLRLWRLFTGFHFYICTVYEFNFHCLSVSCIFRSYTAIRPRQKWRRQQ